MSRFDDPRIEALGMLIETHAELSEGLAADLAEQFDLPDSFLGVLIRLGRSPGGALRMTQLADEMTITTSGLTRLIDRMERADLVGRRPCPTDKRGLLAFITDLGTDTLDEVLPAHVADIDARMARHLTSDELAQLTALLRKVRDGARAAKLPDS